MATFRVGVGSFNIKDGAVGFGTEIDGLGNLRVKGVTKTTGSIVSGASTLTRYSGFAADNINQLENITLTSEVGTIGDIVVGVGTSVIISSASTVTVGTVESVSIGTHFSPPIGGIEDRGVDFVEGMMRFNTDLNTMEFYNGNEWRQFTYISDIKTNPQGSGRAVLFGGTGSSVTKSLIEFFNIATLGNSLNFGSLTAEKSSGGGCSNSIRGLSVGGSVSPSKVNTIEYITIQSEGDAIDFGDQSVTRTQAGGFASSTRGISAGGSEPAYSNVIDYVEIMTLGNALDFGDLSVLNSCGGGNGCSNPIRGVIGGALTNPSSPVTTGIIDSVIISSKGNAVDSGELTFSRRNTSASSNSVRGVFGGGDDTYTDTIDYVTLASLGNAIDFGKLSTVRTNGAGAANHRRATFCGGAPVYPAGVNIIEFVEIATTGDAQDFGDLVQPRRSIAAVSDSHGGLGGY